MTVLSLFSPIDEGETDPALVAFNDLKRALSEAQKTGIHTHEAQREVEHAFQDFLLRQTAAVYHRAYHAGWEAAMQLKGGDS